jgi:hypothetical protein
MRHWEIEKLGDWEIVGITISQSPNSKISKYH